MRVTVRKGPPHLHTRKVPMVIELWIEADEEVVPGEVLKGDALGKATKECVEEHLKTRFRVSRQVATR